MILLWLIVILLYTYIIIPESGNSRVYNHPPATYFIRQIQAKRFIKPAPNYN